MSLGATATTRAGIAVVVCHLHFWFVWLLSGGLTPAMKVLEAHWYTIPMVVNILLYSITVLTFEFNWQQSILFFPLLLKKSRSCQYMRRRCIATTFDLGSIPIF